MEKLGGKDGCSCRILHFGFSPDRKSGMTDVFSQLLVLPYGGGMEIICR